MSTNTDQIPAPKIVGAPAMPTEDMQELLVHRVTEQSIRKMKGKISAVLSLAGLIAGILGLQGYFGIQRVNARFAQVDSLAGVLSANVTDLQKKLAAADDLNVALAARSDSARNDFDHVMTDFHTDAATATRAVIETALQASAASARADRAANTAETRYEAIEQLQGQVRQAATAVVQRDSVVEGIQRQLHTELFGTWSVVLDEGAQFIDLGDSGLQVKASRIDGGSRAELLVVDPHDAMAVVCHPELRVGMHVDCSHHGAVYRITLAWAMKQGLFGGLFGLYPDRVQLQVVRFTGDDHDAPSHRDAARLTAGRTEPSPPRD